jgi:chorismate mutase
MAEKRDVTVDKDLEDWRRRIDAIDGQLMALINSRSACAIEIGRIKRTAGLPVYAPEREAWILDRVMRENPGPLDPMAVRRVFERIIDESRRLERIAAEDEEEGERLEQAAEETLHRKDSDK